MTLGNEVKIFFLFLSRAIFLQSATKLVETLCPKGRLTRLANLKEGNKSFPPLPPPCNVVPLFELPVENKKHPNYEWTGLGRGVDCFVLPGYPIWGQCLNNFVADCKLQSRRILQCERWYYRRHLGHCFEDGGRHQCTSELSFKKIKTNKDAYYACSVVMISQETSSEMDVNVIEKKKQQQQQQPSIFHCRYNYRP